MRAAIFNPYLDTLGGGERYTLSFAKVLLDLGWKVDFQWKGDDLSGKLQKRFGINLEEINFVQDIKRGDGYDLCFWVSDGSIPTLRARNNILHFQVPFHGVGGNSLLNKMKLIRIDHIVCNSLFTKKIIDREYGVDSIVIYPPVDTEHIKPKRKENVILSVGRFSALLQSKGQDVLIDAFKKIYDEGKSDWKMVLAGGVEIGVGNYLNKLKEKSEGYPVEFVESPDFKTLKGLYGKSKIFWSAAGFGFNEENTPEKVEHFGISVVEGMSAGDVPVVFAAGGHKEIVDDGKNGYLWHNTKELVRFTLKAVNERIALSKNAVEKSKAFSYNKFSEECLKIIQKT